MLSRLVSRPAPSRADGRSGTGTVPPETVVRPVSRSDAAVETLNKALTIGGIAGRPSRRPLARSAPVTGAVFVVFGFLFGAAGIAVGVQEHRFETEGAVVEAAILDKTVEHERDHRGNDNVRYVATYRFTTPQGREVDGWAFFAAHAWGALSPGDPLPVRYLPASPGANRPADRDDIRYACALLGGGVMFAFPGTLLLGWSVHRRRRRHRLLREGVAAEALVLGVGPTPYEVRGKRQWRVRYRYNDATGAAREGVSEPLPPEAVSGWRAGDRGTIRYDARRPEVSLWVGEAEPPLGQQRSAATAVVLLLGVTATLIACASSAATVAGPVPGETAASAVLRRDILGMLATCERARAPGCSLKVVDTRVLPGSTLTDHGERWTLDRCGAWVDYDIVMRPTPDGGTDFSLSCRP